MPAEPVVLPPPVLQPLHLFLLLDCSGSMASQGRIQALNLAVREALPHLCDVTAVNPQAKVLVRVVTFSTKAAWHIAEPTPADQVVWRDVEPGGFTDLGSALDLVRPMLSTPPMEPDALPPALVLVSDGMPTDDFDTALEALLRTEWGRQAVRIAVAIGRDADRATLQAFMGPGSEPLAASDPEGLVEALGWAARQASMLASALIDPAAAVVRPGPRLADVDEGDALW